MRNAFGDDGFTLTALPGFIEEIPIPVVLTDIRSQRIIAVNAAACAFFGRTRVDLASLTVSDITAPEDRERTAARFHKAISQHFIADKRYLCGDGTIKDGRVHVIKMPELDHIAAAVIVDTSGFHLTLERARFVNHVTAADASGAEGITAVAADVQAEISRQLGRRVEVSLDEIDAQPGDDRTFIPWNVDPMTLRRGTIALDLDPDDDAARLYVESIAGALGAAASVAALTTALDSALLFEAGFEESPVGMQVLDSHARFVRVNAAFAQLVGRTADELIGMRWQDITHPDDLALPPVTDRTTAGAISERVKRKRYLRPDGSIVWAQVTVSSISVSGAAGGEHTMLLSQVTDLTEVMETMAELHTTHAELATSERRYRALVDPSPDAIARLTAEGIILDANETAATMVGSDRDRVVGRRFHEVVEPVLADVIRSALGRVATTGQPVEVEHYWLTPATGEPGWYRIRVLPEAADTTTGSNVYIVATDITLMVNNERRLSAMALEDSLTGVANRAAMLTRVQHALDRLDRRHGTGLVLASVDIDHFKSINDTFGHAAGDHALQAVAGALIEALRHEDMVARLGGDEFLVLVEDIDDESEVSRIAERLDQALNPILVELPSGQDFKIGSSIGVAYTNLTLPIEDLIARADHAAYEAKRRGRQRFWIDAEFAGSADTPRRSDLLKSLRTGLTRERFVLLYQPLANAAGQIAAVEALLRWYDDDDVLRAPDHFLHTLMETGLMAEVGEWVVAKAIEDLARWQNESSALSGLVMNINVSAGEIVRSGFADFISETMAHAGVDPKSVAFEVTEQSLGDTAISTRALDLIAQTGAQIVLDDFGTGISSLTHLRTKSLNGIKIDRSFISDAMTNDTDRRIAEGVIDLAQRLGIEVTAEGVETWDQANWLLGAKCNLFQGWYVGRPAPAAEVPRFEMPAGLRAAALR